MESCTVQKPHYVCTTSPKCRHKIRYRQFMHAAQQTALLLDTRVQQNTIQLLYTRCQELATVIPKIHLHVSI